MSLGCVGVQVWSTETVNDHEERQVEMCRVNELGAMKDGQGFNRGTNVTGRLIVGG
jgi:hypothetical protein